MTEQPPYPGIDGTGEDTYDGYDDAGGDISDEFAPQPRQRVGKLTIALAALLVAGLGFIGGSEIQKHEGTPTTSGAGALAALRGAAGRGEGGFAGLAGGAGGFGGFAGRTGTGGGTGAGTGAGTGSGTATGGAGTAAVPAVIGQVVSVTGTTVVVKNLGGTSVTVTTTSATTVTKPIGTKDLAAGETVAVYGTATGSDVTATNIKIQQ